MFPSLHVRLIFLACLLLDLFSICLGTVASDALWPNNFHLLAPRQTFINNTGLTDEVGWDSHSFFIRGKRVFLQGGEFHPFRLPVVPLWKDIMQKAKAAGLNTISIYTHWALINPKSGVIDLEGFNDLQPFFDAAKEAGLFVIARPGPYINAETSAGGMPGHILTLPGDTPWNMYNGILRSNATVFHDAWQDYINGVVSVIARNQITEGGPVVMVQLDNEYYNGPGQNEYILELKKAFRKLGIVVPTSHNDPGLYRNLINEPDIYSFDRYPLGFDCTTPTQWRDLPFSVEWRHYHEEVMPNVPLMIPEYQGGAFSRRGRQSNEDCRTLTNPNSMRVLNHHVWMSGSTAVMFFMLYGGTNWGQLAFPDAETTLDYAASIEESRTLSEKYFELKLQSMFIRSFPDFRYTNFTSEDSDIIPGVTVTRLENPKTGAKFHAYRHTTISTGNSASFDETFSGSQVSLTVPGRDSIMAVENLAFGAKSKLVYSTAPLFSHLALDGERDVLVAYGVIGSTYEIAISFKSKPRVSVFGTKDGLTTEYDSVQRVLRISYELQSGITTVALHGRSIRDVLLVLVDYAAATRLWMPTISGRGDHSAYIDIAASAPLLVSGPYLVREATVRRGTLSLTGDLAEDVDLVILAPRGVTRVLWNGEAVRHSKTMWGALQGKLSGPTEDWTPPDLSSLDWHYHDSLPEILPSFDDSDLTPADHTETTSKFPPFYGSPWVLYADDYGYHSGNLLWRGSFENSEGIDAPTAVNLSISGGHHFAASVWLNEHYLGPSYKPSMPTTNESFPVYPSMLLEGTNFVTVLQDHMGHNLAGQIVCCTPGGRQRDLQQPKGIQGYYLEGRDEENQFTGWKVAGNLGGEEYPDKTRKILNEGGLFGERAGWHLPGFDSSSWEKKAPWDGLDKPGVGWFRTSFDLNVPKGYDIQLSFLFASDEANYRAQLYVNGWQMGKRIANLGPQTSFVVHEGILNYQGRNEIALSLWALDDDPNSLKVTSLQLVKTASYLGGVGSVGLVPSPGWKELR